MIKCVQCAEYICNVYNEIHTIRKNSYESIRK